MVDQNCGAELYGGSHTDGERGLFFQPGQVLTGFFQFIKNFFTGPEQDFTGVGQGQFSALSVNQRRIDGRFQFFNGVTDSALGDVQMFSGFGETPDLC